MCIGHNYAVYAVEITACQSMQGPNDVRITGHGRVRRVRYRAVLEGTRLSRAYATIVIVVA